MGHTKDIMTNAEKAIELFPEEVLDVMERERRYSEAMQEWSHYQKWLATNNKKRTIIERKNGYDTKSGMHIVRLLSVCRELVQNGTMTVRRPDADLLLDIRNGGWTYEKLMEWIDEAMGMIRQAEKSSPLPEEPNETYLDEQLVYIIEHKLGLYAIE
jgi:predicted RNase H-like HicB family nuclease